MSQTTKRILVGTDHPAGMEPILSLVRSTAHAVTVLGTLAACARLERGEPCDLLMVDIEPPGMAGFDVIRAYRSGRAADLPVLALSSAFKREHIEGMLENVAVRRLFPLDARPEEILFWINQALFPEAMRSRKTPRIPASFALVIGGSKRVLQGRAFNLSEDGLFLETTLEAAPGDFLDLSFHLPSRRPKAEPIATRCEVVWSNPKPPGKKGHPPYGIGLRFLDLDERCRREVKSYVLNGLLEITI